MAKYRFKLLDVEIETPSGAPKSSTSWKSLLGAFFASLLAGLVLYLLL